MPGNARIRNRSYNVVAGTATWHNGDVSPSPSSYTVWETCSDVIGNRTGSNPFYLERKTNLVWFAKGRMRDNGFGWTYNGYAMTMSPTAHMAPTTPEPSDEESLTTALAGTNPSRPVVDVPVFLFELKDIPRTIQFFTRSGWEKWKSRPIKTLGEYHLTQQYGVNTYMRDLFRMIDFQESTERRFKEFKNLQDGKSGLGRTWTVWENTVKVPFWNYLTPLYQESNIVDVTVDTAWRKWVSTRWHPDENFSDLSDEQLLQRARQVVSGAELSFATLWETMPWSWMIDWYSNIGDVVAATRNTVGATFGESCIMKSAFSGLSPVINTTWSSASCGVKGNPRMTVNLQRTPTGTLGPSVDFSLPILSGNQLSILSAIVATRM